MAEPLIAEVKSINVFGEGMPYASIGAYAPNDPEHFGVAAQGFIGTTTSDLVDSFDLLVCSPSWMAAKVQNGEWSRFRTGGLSALPESIAVGTGIWFVRSWNAAELESAIRLVCAEFSPGPDWGSVAARVGRLIPWEFDYKYDAHVNEHYGETFPPSR